MKLRKVKEYEFKSGDIISVNHEGGKWRIVHKYWAIRRGYGVLREYL